jgi:hypothetical protein
MEGNYQTRSGIGRFPANFHSGGGETQNPLANRFIGYQRFNGSCGSKVSEVHRFARNPLVVEISVNSTNYEARGGGCSLASRGASLVDGGRLYGTEFTHTALPSTLGSEG